jgi:hypothetical protein
VAGLRAALPVELQLDAGVAVGVDGGVQAHHQGGLRAPHGGAGVNQAALRIHQARAHRHAGALGAKARFVQRLVAGVGGCGLLAGAHHAAQQVLQAGLHIGAEVVAGAVHHAQHHKAGLVIAALGQAALVLGVLQQREGGARLQGAHGGRAFKALALGLQALLLDQHATFGLGGGFVGVGAGLVHMPQGHGLRVVGVCFRAGGVAAHNAVVPAGAVHAGARDLAVAMPAGDAVFLEHGTGLGVADAGLRVGGKSTVVVGNHQGVGTERAQVAARHRDARTS